MELVLTGERTLPGIAAENYWFRRHEAAYLAAVGWLPARARLLEAGLGEGYGAALLAAAGHRVVGLDYDPAAAAHAAASYPDVYVVRGNVVALPFPDASFDAVVSMQVVEHLWDQPGYVAECARVLRPGGQLVISTPNRLTFTPGSDTPTNPFHTREFSDAELADLLAPHLTDLTRYGLRAGPRLARLDAACRDRYGTDLIGAQLATPPSRWPAWLGHTVAGVGAGDFTLDTDAIDDSLDLVIHARR
ncbi:MAG: class I SAM-dependent methyltransferase [Micromonosporaceae bacterium]